ncbi:MAG: hypothetical protein FWG11_00185 [Promicromonosporaceae bacterium]|nr:hypothetical protein [Promicromonosporaceae bacterium]
MTDRTIPFAVGVDGSKIAIDPHWGHCITVGATRSGKSCTCYSLLAGVARDQSIAVVGCDPSSVLLGPFADAAPDGNPHIFLGTSEATLLAFLEFLAYLLAVMDWRIAKLRRIGRDKLRPSPGLPTVLLVLEEYAGLLAAFDVYDATRKPADRLKPLVLGYIGRLLREGAKVQMLVWCILQRPDAAIIGGADRSQYSRRITHRLDNADGVRMLN